jgi:hypothetical protein
MPSMMSKEHVRRAARTPAGMAGLVLIAIAVLSALAGGVAFGMLIDDQPARRPGLQLYVAIQVGAALVLGVLALCLWYRAAAATRQPPSRS